MASPSLIPITFSVSSWGCLRSLAPPINQTGKGEMKGLTGFELGMSRFQETPPTAIDFLAKLSDEWV